MSLSKLPILNYDPPSLVGTVYLVLKTDAGYWRGDGLGYGTKLQAKLIDCVDADGLGQYRPALADLTGLPAGPHEYLGFIKAGADKDIAADGPPFDGDDEWYWDGDSGETLAQVVEEAAGNAIENGTGDGTDVMTVTLTKAGGIVVPGVKVWVTSDADGLVQIGDAKTTDDGGEASFLVTFGRGYYVWARGGGVADVLGNAVTAAADVAVVVTDAGSAGMAVGKYVTQADLEEEYDAEVIRQWSRKGPGEEATDVAAVQNAIDNAEALVDSKLKKRYLLPLTDPDGNAPITATDAAVLLLIALPIAASGLFFQRPAAAGDDQANSLRADKKAALDELKLYVEGTQYLDAPRVDRTPRAPGIA